MSTDPVLAARSRLGHAVRYGTSAEVTAARQQLAAAKIARAQQLAADKAERAIRRALDGAPPLSDEQKAQITAALGGAR